MPPETPEILPPHPDDVRYFSGTLTIKYVSDAPLANCSAEGVLQEMMDGCAVGIEDHEEIEITKAEAVAMSIEYGSDGEFFGEEAT